MHLSCNANDASGNNNHGTVTEATLTADRFGIANKAYSFDGINDLIRVVDNSSLNFSSSFSTSFWIKINAWRNGTSSGIISKKQGDAYAGYVFYNDGLHPNKINFRLSGSTNYGYMPSNTSITTGTWEFWTIVLLERQQYLEVGFSIKVIQMGVQEICQIMFLYTLVILKHGLVI